METRRIVIKGPKVHDVGYRALLLEEAEFLVIPNFSARNIENDTEIVEGLVGGDEEKVDAFVEFAEKNSPKKAEVADISVEGYEGDIMTIEVFSRGFSASQLSKIATVGNDMVEKQTEHITLTKEHIALTKEHRELTKEHMDITKKGFEGVTNKLKSFKNLREDVKELRQASMDSRRRCLG